MGKKNKIVERIEYTQKALSTLHIALRKLKETPESDDDYMFFRDSLIQRFEYSVDLFWKTLREFIIAQHGLEVPASPKGVIKIALDVYLIDDQEYKQLIAAINDRNLTSHAYREQIAIQIAFHIQDYYQLMEKIIRQLTKKMQS